ncbi:uncharacterized protein LOC119572074, partial [Penaeus monodon]|uniref:uncharacterized protein LOC119572074 n=1 Tax=Penaeus monodon TaxID=6687 RepID=UPI0018A7762C
MVGRPFPRAYSNGTKMFKFFPNSASRARHGSGRARPLGAKPSEPNCFRSCGGGGGGGEGHGVSDANCRRLRHFGVTLEDAKLIEKCLELCRAYGVDGEGIAACWISFASNNGYDSLTPEGLDHFEREELTKNKKMVIKKTENFQIYDASTIDEIAGEDDNDLIVAYGGTPTPKQRSKRQLTPDNNIVKRHVGPSRSISAQFSPASISP